MSKVLCAKSIIAKPLVIGLLLAVARIVVSPVVSKRNNLINQETNEIGKQIPMVIAVILDRINQ